MSLDPIEWSTSLTLQPVLNAKKELTLLELYTDGKLYAVSSQNVKFELK